MAQSTFPKTDLADMLLQAATLPTGFFTEMMWLSAVSAGWLAAPGANPEQIGDALVEDARMRFDVLSRYTALADDFVSGRRRAPAASFWD